MPCCGKLLQQYRGAVNQANAPRPEPATSAADPQFVIRFEYIGQTGLTVIGPVSGRRYRFDRPSAQVAIDPRDRPGLASVPKLRQVGG